MITIDKLNRSVIVVKEKSRRNRVRHPRKRWYNVKTPRGAKKVKTMINFMYHEKKETDRMFFITITTCQHKTGISDGDLFARVGLWLKNRKLDYVVTVERQRSTEDLHFHIVVLSESGKRFDIQRELGYLGRLFESQSHPALFDIKRISGIKNVIGYINKYVTKQGTEYCSLFRCRTFSVAKRLSARYKKNARKYVRRIGGSEKSKSSYYEFFTRLSSKPKALESMLKPKHETDFFKAYQYNEEIWCAAVETTLRGVRPKRERK